MYFLYRRLEFNVKLNQKLANLLWKTRSMPCYPWKRRKSSVSREDTFFPRILYIASFFFGLLCQSHCSHDCPFPVDLVVAIFGGIGLVRLGKAKHDSFLLTMPQKTKNSNQDERR